MGLWANSIIYYLFDCKGPTRKPSLAITKTKLYIRYLIEFSVISMTFALCRHLAGPMLEWWQCHIEFTSLSIRSNHMLRKCYEVTLSLSAIERCEVHSQRKKQKKKKNKWNAFVCLMIIIICEYTCFVSFHSTQVGVPLLLEKREKTHFDNSALLLSSLSSSLCNWYIKFIYVQYITDFKLCGSNTYLNFFYIRYWVFFFLLF